jgi:hypothetical protein
MLFLLHPLASFRFLQMFVKLLYLAKTFSLSNGDAVRYDNSWDARINSESVR